MSTPPASEKDDDSLDVRAEEAKIIRDIQDGLAQAQEIAGAGERIRLENDGLRAEVAIKSPLTWLLVVTTIGQLIIIDGVFFLYAWLGKHWNVPVSAIQVWLGATLIQLTAIVHTIVRGLYQKHRSDKDHE